MKKIDRKEENENTVDFYIFWEEFIWKYIWNPEKRKRLEIAVEFVDQFSWLEIFYGPPIALSINKKHVEEGHYEDFLSLQNHNPQISEFLKGIVLE